jgi:DNA-binding NarL/FixJ family response regulator
MTGARWHILCIEDEPETAALVAEELGERGFTVEISKSAPEGLMAVIKATPDLVLCDIKMPGMTGFEFLERLNELTPRLGKIRVVFLTGLTDRDNELKARLLGADDYVTKPIDFDRLELIIRARIEGRARAKPQPQQTRLNDREAEILTWVGRGMGSTEIGRLLHLSKRTVDFHVDNARRKLGAGTRVEAVLRATASGLIKP